MFLYKKLLLIHKPILQFLSVAANVYSCNRGEGDSGGYDDDDDDDVYNFRGSNIMIFCNFNVCRLS